MDGSDVQHAQPEQRTDIPYYWPCHEVSQLPGPGLLESNYQRCLCYELQNARIPFVSRPLLPIHYQDVELDAAYRPDLVVADQVILELKAVDQFAPIHEAQLLTYLRLSGIKVGLLINFNVVSLTKGIRRRILGSACSGGRSALQTLDSAAELPSTAFPASV